MPPDNSPAESHNLNPRHLLHNPLRSPSPNTLLPGLRELASPVLDLASTLTIEAEEVVDGDNVDFLRRPAEAEITGDALTLELRHDERRAERTRPPVQGRSSASSLELLRRADEETRERRLHQRRMAQLRAQMEPRWSAQERSRSQQPPPQQSSHAPYSGQVPNQQSLYDWAPAHDDRIDDELEDILAELRAEQPNTHPDILQSLGRARLERSSRSQHTSAESAPAAPSHEPSLRSSAILQSIRRNHRISARSRNLMERYMLDRERSNAEQGANDSLGQVQEPQQRESFSSVLARIQRDSFLEGQRNASRDAQHSYQPLGDHSQQASSLSTLSSRLNQRSTSSMANLARHQLEESRPSDRCTRFERAIRSLHWLQSPSASVKDLATMMSKAESENLSPKYLREELFDGIRAGVGPYHTSWLAPGSVFMGSQSASGPQSTTNSAVYRLSDLVESTTPTALQSSSTRSAERSGPWTHFSSSPPAGATCSRSQDRWTVKVAVHAVDWENMTLQGTMEAFDVPSLNSNSNGRRNALPAQSNITAESTKASFSTFLEGELIDFKQHTLLTDADTFKATKATPATDAQYWRKLEPFANMHDDQISNSLADAKWIEEELNGKYILMRWKERCFVKDTLSSSSPRSASAPASASTSTAPGASSTRSENATTMNAARESGAPVMLHNVDGNGYGLSISGFYYVSLRRRDGAVTGLYFDPQSSPYQHLEMGPCSPLFGAGSWAFR